MKNPIVTNPLKGKTEKSWLFEQQVYDMNGIARAIKSGNGSGNIPKVIIYDDNSDFLRNERAERGGVALHQTPTETGGGE